MHALRVSFLTHSLTLFLHHSHKYVRQHEKPSGFIVEQDLSNVEVIQLEDDRRKVAELVNKINTLLTSTLMMKSVH